MYEAVYVIYAGLLRAKWQRMNWLHHPWHYASDKKKLSVNDHQYERDVKGCWAWMCDAK